MTTSLKLGKMPATKDSRDLRMLKYFTGAPIPQAPASYGHYQSVQDWGMLANDKYGCCVPAGLAHLLKMWREMWKRADISISDEQVLQAYHEITELMNPGNGFNPETGENDTGCNMRIALNWFKNVGYPDADGNRHKIVGYGIIDPKDVQRLNDCANIFDGVAIGFEVTQDAMNQFQQHFPWDVQHHIFGQDVIIGGHCVPLVGRMGNVKAVTWGTIQDAKARFLAKYNDEAYVIVTEELLNDGKSLEGFDMDTFIKDLSLVGEVG
jgi:hypothetical protein